MRLLVITQKVDKNDSVLGFFHGWIAELSKKIEKVSVICLEKGEYNLPENVQVFSLGKESGKNKIKFVKNFFNLILGLHKEYDCVFVHMNQEYVLLGGLIWKLIRKKVYFWRNHGSGSLLTRIAVALSSRVFCTSKQSFTAKFKKTAIMPVGVDTETFKPIPGITRKKYSVCMVGRISLLKHVDKALFAVNHLIASGTPVYLSIVGPVFPKDADYYEKLKKYVAENNLSENVFFVGAVAPLQLPEIYSSHEVCINLSEYGMFDKTILESAACGTIPLVSNPSLANIPQELSLSDNSPEGIAHSIQRIFKIREESGMEQKLTNFVKSHSLHILVEKLLFYFNEADNK